MREKKNWWKGLSAFEKMCVILIPALILTVIITAIIIVNKNEQIADLNRRNDEIKSSFSQTTSTETSFIQPEILDFCLNTSKTINLND